MKNIKVFLSDEGFGHIVRQVAIYKEMVKLDGSLKFNFQTSNHLDRLKSLIPKATFTDRFNNIVWQKNSDGTPDLGAIEKYYKDYSDVSTTFLKEDDSQFDVCLSDFVYEAFQIAESRSVPSFGIAHFTWEWFFSKLYPPPLSRSLINHFLKVSKLATKIYFPPFTPKEIIAHFGSKAKEVPLIVNVGTRELKNVKSDKFTILFIDSGAGIMKDRFSTIIKSLNNDGGVYSLASELILDHHTTNSYAIPAEEMLVDYIPSADLVIGRAGFNTISECIAYRTPMLLLGEANNPEMLENIMELKKQGLASFVDQSALELYPAKTLDTFIRTEFPEINNRMKNHDFEINGAEVVAKDILDQI